MYSTANYFSQWKRRALYDISDILLDFGSHFLIVTEIRDRITGLNKVRTHLTQTNDSDLITENTNVAGE